MNGHGRQGGGRMYSVGQTLIFSSHCLPAVTWFVDVIHNPEIVLGWMDLCRRRTRIISLCAISERGGRDSGQRPQIYLIFLKTMSNALLKGWPSILFPWAVYHEEVVQLGVCCCKLKMGEWISREENQLVNLNDQGSSNNVVCPYHWYIILMKAA